MSTETIAGRLSREGAALRGISADCLKLADAAGEGRAALRKIGGGSLPKALGSLDRIETTCRDIAETTDRIARQPLPLCLQDAPAAGEA